MNTSSIIPVPPRPTVTRRSDMVLALRAVEVLRARGLEPIGYRATEGDRATKGRWKGFVVEYTPFMQPRPTKCWSEVKLIVERGVLTVGAWGPLRTHPGPITTSNPVRAADYVMRVLATPCSRCAPGATPEQVDLMCEICRQDIERLRARSG